MKLCIPCALLVGGVLGAVAVTQIAAGPDDKKTTQPPAGEMKMDPQMLAQMEQCKKDGMPGEAHKRMAETAGTWDAACQFWMAPNTPPMPTQGKMVSKPEFGGRFIVGEFSSSFGGEPFTGRATWGYNNVEKRYESTWIDSEGSGISFMTGNVSADGKTFTSTGESSFNKPGGSKVKSQVREVVRIISPDKHVMEMFRNDGSGEWKVMEITYTRAK